MQPYFFPYAGYYRLLATVDLFMIFDCVQFVRRGRIHRSQVPVGTNGTGWLTLAVEGAEQATRIDQIRLAADARPRLGAQLARLPWFTSASGPHAERVKSWLMAPVSGETLADYLEYTLRETASLLGLKARIARTSSLSLAPALRGQERVIAAARAVGATHYVNAPGGAALYEQTAFSAAGLQLSFLRPYQGRYPYILPALLQRPAGEVADDIHQASSFTDS
jgi:hypothetical protein